MAEMFTVMAAAAAEDWALLGRRFQLRFRQDRTDRRAIVVLESARVGSDPAVDYRLKAVVDLE